MTAEHDTLVVLRLLAVAAGGLVALFALRLSHRNPSDKLPYLLLAAGFCLVALAAVVEGALYEAAGWDLASAATAEASLSAAGFALILAAVRLSGVGAGNPPVAPPST